MNVQTTIFRTCKALTIIAALVIASLPVSASAAPTPDPRVLEAQRIMQKFGIPTGDDDGLSGPQTSRGLCAFRYMAGLPVTRNNLDNTTLARLRSYNKAYSSIASISARLPEAGSARTYVLVNETCQAMYYVEGLKFRRVMATSTGNPNKPKGVATRNDTYTLRGTEKGWHCSSLSPDTCRDNTGLGVNAYGKGRTYGNMYNKRHLYNGVYVHGSTKVPTYPDSLGCIRVTVADSDWMYYHVGNTAQPPIIVTGAYKW